MAKIRDLSREQMEDRLVRALESGRPRRIYDAQKDLLGWELIYEELTTAERTTKHRLLAQLVTKIEAHDRAERQRVETPAAPDEPVVPAGDQPQADPRVTALAAREARRAGLRSVG